MRSLSQKTEAVRPYVPIIGGPRMYLLLLYVAIIIGVSIEFFMSQETWYGSWEVYNSYVFAVTGVFVFLGMIMLFNTYGVAEDAKLPIPLKKEHMGFLGLILFAASGVAVIALGSGNHTASAVLSVLLVAGFLMMVLGSKSISTKDGLWLSVFGIGVLLMVSVPVHDAFVEDGDIANYPFSSGTNVFLLTAGFSVSLLSMHFLRTRDGYLGAWLIGAMVIFLVSFHEQLGILPSENYEPYDRTLAFIGVTFSFLPLALYMWREKEYFSLWSKVRRANAMVQNGDYVGAIKLADAALEQSDAVGISRKFSLPWVVKGDAYYRMKQYNKARSHYDIALEIDPKDSVSWCHLGNIYSFEGKRSLALTAYERAVAADPRNSDAWNNKGVIFNSIGMPEEAMTSFRKAIEINPDHFDARMNLAREYVKKNRSDEAVEQFQEALRIRPQSESAREGLQREFFKSMCLDQIRGWEQMGLDTTYLKSLVENNLEDFEKRSKEFLTSIVEQKTQLTIGMGASKLDVNEAIKNILRITADKGATLERIIKETGYTKEQLVLPMALLMKTDHLHFRKSGTHDMYVSQGKAPAEPTPPPRAPAPPEREPKSRERKQKESRSKKEEADEEPEPEPTASVLVFGKRKRRSG